jgi:chromosome partitioning protein
MTRIICVINNKGGVGKTNVSVNLSAFLAGLGKRVLLVDFDHQANASFSVGIQPRNLSLSVYHALMNSIEPEQVIRNTSILGFDIMPASPDLAGAPVELVSEQNREFKLSRMLEKIQDNYDFILIDTPPSLGLLTINALCAAEEVLIPLQAEYLAMEGLHQLVDTIALIEDNIGHTFRFVGAVLTMYNRNSVLSRDVAKEIKGNFSGHIFETVIPRSIVLAQAPKSGKTILQFAPSSKAANAYKLLAREVIALCEEENKQEQILEI